jgi:hypothetical protein
MPKGIRPNKKNKSKLVGIRKMDNYDSVGFRNSAIRRINSTPGDVEIYNPSTGTSKLVYAPKGSREEKILDATLRTKNPMDKR